MSKDYCCLIADGRKLKIEIVEDSDCIDKSSAMAILVLSFINEYKKYLNPQDIDPKLKHWFSTNGQNSVEQYYNKYFETELEDFNNGNLYWLEAKIDDVLVGWATYERSKTPSIACYMNLLVVDPVFNRKGIGSELVQAVFKLPLIPNTSSINLLLRKKNQGGKIFYSKLGFKSNPNFKRDNFVDTSLLEGWTLALDNTV